MSWRPTASMNALRQRARLLGATRAFFDSRGFIEVQTPCLSRDVVVDRYIEPIRVELELPGERGQFWLQTSPEFAMKRLLAAGAEAVYQLGPVFRGGEAGARHNPEFTMLEWYRMGDDYAAGMTLLDEFSQALLASPPARRISYREAFVEFGGCDPFSSPVDGDQLNRILVERIEPALRSEVPSTIIYDWPVDQAALARIGTTDEGHAVARRFELFVEGVELANGYHELTDADELLARNIRINELRRGDSRRELPVESRLLDAMREGLPACSGVALGFDRLVMLSMGTTRIDDVLCFPASRA